MSKQILGNHLKKVSICSFNNCLEESSLIGWVKDAIWSSASDKIVARCVPKID